LRVPDNRKLGLALLVIGLLALVSLVPGLLGRTPLMPLRVLLGWGAFVAVIALIIGGIVTLVSTRLGRRIRWGVVALGELLVIVLLVISHLTMENRLDAALAGRGGGLVGWAGSELLTELVGPVGTRILLIAAGLVVAWFLWRALPLPQVPSVSSALSRWVAGRREAVSERLSQVWIGGALAAVWDVLRNLSPTSGNQSPDSFEEPIAPSAAKGRKAKGPAGQATISPSSQEADGAPANSKRARQAQRPKPDERAVAAKPRPATLPALTLLKPDQGDDHANADSRQRAQILRQTLAEFGVPVEVVSIKEGPTVTQFGLEPGEIVRELRNGEVQRRRVSVHRIMRLSNDLALALAAHSIRIEAPVPGRPYVGVEIPNTAKTLVSLRNLLESREFGKVGSPLTVALGRDVSGDPVVADLTAMPHLLIAGATGSGKSVCINAIVCALLMNNGPENVRFVMVDPKMVELPSYNGIPHLIGSVITDPSQVTGALAWLTMQMDERYRAFAEIGVRNIAQYNRKVARSRSIERMPYILLVIDELADLMMTAAYDTERQVCRLAQMARATGIHLVLATQRPSVDVVTGLIKANFPARIAFAVTSQIDSRVVLDTPGAEKLLGRGDMLFMAPDSPKLVRIQGCFVSDGEIDAIVDFWKASYPPYEAGEPPLPPWASFLDQPQGRDELLEEALGLLQSKSHVSTSMLQRQLRIGFPRAARVMEQLEEMGMVGPDEGGGRSRQVMSR
jgi:S-DNA-T family DNA segregation ATPase FtsK/SpoIIIE